MSFEYSPYILPLIAAMLVSGWSMFYMWPHRRMKGIPMLILLAAGAIIWVSGYALEIAGADLATKVFWGKFQYFGITIVPITWVFFTLTYTNPSHQSTRWNVVPLCIIPVITLVLTMTTETHGWVWKEYDIFREKDFSVLSVVHGWWFWVYWAYAQLLVLAGTVIMVRSLIRARGAFRGQRVLFFLAALAPWIGNLIYVIVKSSFDFTPFGFAVSVAALVWAIFGFRLMDITPLARDLVMDAMREGMIVLDARGNVVDINNAAARMIGVPVANAIGKTAEDVFHPWARLVEQFRDVLEAKDEISVGEGEARRRYEVRLSPLQDQQGQFVGRVIMLRAMDEAEVPQPRFARSAAAQSDTRPYYQVGMEEAEHSLPKKPSLFLRALADFYYPRIKNDLAVPGNFNPIWYRTRERMFTLVARLTASFVAVGVLFFVFSEFRSVIGSIVLAAIVALFLFVGGTRNVNYYSRVIVFFSLVYVLGIAAALNFGFTAPGLVFFMFYVVASAALTSPRGAFYALATGTLTVGIFAVLLGSGTFAPLRTAIIGGVFPFSVLSGLGTIFLFASSAFTLLTSVVLLLDNLDRAWQKETQTFNLLQQERDLLEQRVGERTLALSRARDEAEKISNDLRKYFRAIEQSGSTIVVTDADGNIEYANPRFVRSTGYTLAEAAGKTPRILKSGRQPQEFYRQMWKTISGGQVWEGEFLNKRKDGSLYWEFATIAPVIDHDGKITNYVAIKEDITERKQAEEQLLRLSQAVEQSGNTVLVMDENGLIEYVNPKFTEVTGYSSAEALGKSPIALMNGFGATPNFHQDDWWLTVKSGRIWHGEFHNHRKDGTMFWESATIAPVLNRNGEIINFVEIKQDITEQKILQEQLQKQNDYLSILHQVTLDLLNRRDLNDLLQVIVDRSAVLMDAPYSKLWLEEDGDLVLEAFTGYNSAEKGERSPHDPLRLSWQAFDSRQPVVLEDYNSWEYKRGEYTVLSLRAVAEIPIMAGERSLGVLALARTQSGYTFTPEQVETGILFARLVALVLDNASLYESAMTEIAERSRVEEILLNQNQYLNALQKTTFEMLQSRDVASLLNTITVEAASLVGAQYGDIYLSEGDDLVVRATNREQISMVGSREKKPAAGLLGEVWRTLQPVVVENYAEWEGRNPSYFAWNLRAVAGVPIIGRDGPLGVLEVARMKDNPLQFTSSEIEVFTQFARLASLVLDNASLYASATREIAERKYTETLLLESEARFRQIVENASDIIYRTDAKGNFTYANPAAMKMMGYASEREIFGRHYLEQVMPEYRHRLKRFYDHQYLSRTQNTYYEFPVITADGNVAWVGQSVQLIMDGEQVIGFQALGRDITQLKQAQEALALSRDQALEASRFKGQLLSRVSHELRTPLGGILGYSELLQFKAFGKLNENQQNAVKNIIESTNYLTEVVNDLLDEAQIESKSLSLYNEYFDPVDLLEKTKVTMSVLTEKKGLEFVTEMDSDLPGELYGDVNRLRQILVNLVGNSIKFTKQGRIIVRFKRPTPAQWSIEVQDTGVGIPVEDQQNIFEPFRQVNNSITRGNRGSGLGLAITKQLVELMGGQVSLESQVGEGSLFTVTLPIANAPGE